MPRSVFETPPRLCLFAYLGAASLAALITPLISPAADTSSSCAPLDNTSSDLAHWQVNLDPRSAAVVSLSIPAKRDVALVATESDTDVVIDLNQGVPSDNPIRRTGTQLLLTRNPTGAPLLLRIQAKPHAEHITHVFLRAFDIDSPVIDAECRRLLNTIASADSAYAEAQAIVSGRTVDSKESAPDRFRYARAQYESAFDAATKEPSHIRAELAHAVAAIAYQDLYDWRASEMWASASTKLYRASNDSYNVARTEALQAAAWMEIATLPSPGTANQVIRRDSDESLSKAIKQLQRLAQYHAQHAQPYDEALQLNNIGLAYYYQGLYNDAIINYRRALSIYAKIGERYREAQVYQNIAVVDGEMNRYEDAILGYSRALDLLNREDSPKLYADILNNCALANLSSGHLEAALKQNGEALEIQRRIQEHREEGRTLFGIARVYAEAGNYPVADQFLRQSLTIRTPTLDARGRVDTLCALAFVADQQERTQDALKFTQEALAIAVDPAVRVRVLSYLAEYQSRLHLASDAARSIELASEIARGADPASRGTAALERSAIERRIGELPSAHHDALYALNAFRDVSRQRWVFAAHVALAQIEDQQGRPLHAVRHLDHALKLSEHIRAEAYGPELRAGLMESLRSAYDLEIDILASQLINLDRHDAKHAARLSANRALEVAEKYRARTLRELMKARWSDSSSQDIRTLVAEKSKLLAALAQDRTALGINADSSASPRLSTTVKHIAQLTQQISLIDAQLSESARLSQSTLSSPGGIPQRLRGIARDTAIVAYWFTPQHAYAWVAIQRQVTLLDLGDPSTIRKAALEMYASHGAITEQTASMRLQSSAQLSRLIIEPVLRSLTSKQSRLIIIPDGPLHYTSFAALVTPYEGHQHFLIEDFSIAYIPSLLALRPAPPRQETDGRMLLVADPVYEIDDSRLSAIKSSISAHDALSHQSWGDTLVDDRYTRIPGTTDEASAIAKILPRESIDRLEGLAATRSGVLALPLERYRYIHFAVHGKTDATMPQLSSIILSAYDSAGARIENHLWAGDLMTRAINAEVIVFSACETALGPRISGEGMIGLRYMALARGAGSVVASLWKVPDQETEALMADFYGQLITKHQTAESALAHAMRRLISTGPNDPALWSSFTVLSSSL